MIDGEEIDDKKNIDRIRAEVGMVFQHFNLFENMTVLKNVEYAMKINKEKRAGARETALEMLRHKKSRE